MYPTVPSSVLPRPREHGMARYLPCLGWLRQYRLQDVVSDALAGAIVAIMLVPQSMAYALLAGLPPQMGLYASMAPLLLYGLLGSSRTLSVGPVAIDSLLVAAGLASLAQPGSAQYVALALALAGMVGLLQLGMGALRLGFLVNFLSQPVLSGFISAAALVIAGSQIQHLLGLSMPRTESFFVLIYRLVIHSPDSRLVPLGLGLGSLLVLFYFRSAVGRHLARWWLPEAGRDALTRSGPLVVVVLGTLLVWGLGLHTRAAVKVVGAIPAGLPSVTVPALQWEHWQALLPLAITLSLVGFMESISVAKSLASRRRQKVDADQELIALGMANLGAAFTGGYSVSGGLSRSVVNFSAGARTGLASIITSLLVALTVLWLIPLLYYLPQVVLATVIIMAAISLIDMASFRQAWRYNKAEAAVFLLTFGSVLALGVETGIVVGTVAALTLYLWHTSRPHVAIVGRVGDSEHFRNIRRHHVTTVPHVLAMRVDESLYFANTRYLEDVILGAVADTPEVRHVVLICSAVNYIDTSALETLNQLIDDLRQAGVDFYLAEVKGPVMDRLQRAGFVDRLGAERIFLSTHQAMQTLEAMGTRPGHDVPDAPDSPGRGVIRNEAADA
jgi:SulP family sulfate permease